jgi:cell division protein FtsN
VASTSYYSVQVGSFREAAEADKLRQQLVQKGYEVRVRLFMLPGKGPWYRVRVGSFAKRAAAEKAARRFRTRERMPAIVTVEAR